MKSKIYHDSLPTLPIYPSTADINFNQTEMSRENGYWYDEIFLVKAGNGILTIDSESYLLEENDMFFIHAGIPHEYHRIGDKFVTSYLSYFGSSTDNILEYYSLGNFGVFKGKNKGAFESKLLQLFEDFDKIQELSIISTATYNTVITFFDEACRKERTPLEKVYDYLNTNYAKQITLEDILSVYPFSRTKLCTDFKKEYGASIFDVLTSLRLNHAQLMLFANPHLPLKKIANSTGFSDISYFCKMFKRKYGHSPKQDF